MSGPDPYQSIPAALRFRHRRVVAVLGLLFASLVPAVAGPLTDRLLTGEDVPPPERPKANDADGEAEPIDLHRPVVSRGFGGEEGGVPADYNAGVMAFFFKDYARAARLWRGLAEHGYARAQANLARLYQSGQGVERDLAQAFQWYRKAAEQGHIVAQNNLGVMYEHGWGVAADPAAAATWYRRAAEQGYGFAQYNLAVLLLAGPDRDEGERWLREAAAQGVADASRRLEQRSGAARLIGEN